MSWLTARPIAHRGFHTLENDFIENCTSSFKAAMAANYSIECDIQLTQECEAVVFHDFNLERLMAAKGEVRSFTVAQLQAFTYLKTGDKMLTLQQLFELVDDKVGLVVEIKSKFDGDLRLTKRAIEVALQYTGKLALMSFDPVCIAYLAQNAPHLMRGIVGQNHYEGDEWGALSSQQLQAMAELKHFNATQPHFLSWRVKDLPAPPTKHFRETLKRPVICWTVRSEEDRRLAALHADQVTFEGYAA